MESDDDELMLIRQRRLAEMREGAKKRIDVDMPPKPKKDLKQHCIIPDYEKVTDSYYDRNESAIIKNYINNGIEINDRLRRRGKDDENDIKLDTVFSKVSNLFGEGDFIKVCRVMSQEYEIEKSGGYISTSNKCLQFGGIVFPIYIPKDAKIVIADISKTTFIPNTYEIILPRETRLSMFMKEDELLFYAVETPFLEKNRDLVLQLDCVM